MFASGNSAERRPHAAVRPNLLLRNQETNENKVPLPAPRQTTNQAYDTNSRVTGAATKKIPEKRSWRQQEKEMSRCSMAAQLGTPGE